MDFYRRGSSVPQYQSALLFPYSMPLSDLIRSSYLGSKIGHRPAKQCIFLHLGNLSGLGVRPAQAVPSSRRVPWLTPWLFLPQLVVLPKARLFRAKWCACLFFPPCFALLFPLFLFLKYASRDKHSSRSLGSCPGTSASSVKPVRACTLTLGVPAPLPQARRPSSLNCCLCLSLPAH